VKLLFIMLVVVGIGYGVYNAGQAAYGWFEMSSVVSDIAEAELPKLRQETQQGGFGLSASAERFGKIRAAIMKGAAEHGVPLRAEDVVVSAADNRLEVRLSWDAPMVTYQGKSYLELPISVQKSYSLGQGR
jgi:hypothetical protein